MPHDAETKPEIKGITPPYLSIARLDKTLELLSTRNFTELTVPLFMGYGFGKIDAQLAVSALRFLGIVNDAGQPTELVPKLRLKGDVRKQEFEKIVRAAYKKLFDVIDTPQNLSSDELHNEFIAQYGLSTRVVGAAIRVFIKLCEYAGLKEEGSIVGRVRKAKVKVNGSAFQPSKPTGKTPQAGQPRAVLTGITFPLSDDLSIEISPELNNRLFLNDNLNTKWRAAFKSMKAFADEASIKDDKTGSEEPV